MIRLLVLCVLLTISTAQTLSPIVETSEGLVRGLLADDGDYYAFYGLRYGADTGGLNRFKAPNPPPSFDYVHTASDRNILCPQKLSLENTENLILTEDCLRLSIFTPREFNTSSNPVFVYVIGEEYSTSYPTQHSFRKLVEQKVTVVAINYRLSVLGFLCLGIEEAPGNAGLKDVVQALKWIKNNIEQFGGNPNNVILFGHGSGAAMVDLVTMSPLADGLVHKAITQSGSALAPWAVSYTPVESAFYLGKLLGYSGNNRSELVDSLMLPDPMTLVAHTLNYDKPNLLLFAPCVESEKLDPDNRFLTDAPYNLLNQGNFSMIPFIIGYADLEGSVRDYEAVHSDWLQRMDKNFEDFYPVDIRYSDGLKNSIRQYYFGDSTINMNQIENYTYFHGDTLTVMSVVRGANLRSDFSTTNGPNVFLLKFGYRLASNTDYLFPLDPHTGARHGDLLNFLHGFGLHYNEVRVSDALIDRYVNFFNTGEPSASSQISSVPWKPFLRLIPNTFQILGGRTEQGFTLVETVNNNPESQRYFWDPIYAENYVLPPMVDSGVFLHVSRLLLSLTLIISMFYL